MKSSPIGRAVATEGSEGVPGGHVSLSSGSGIFSFLQADTVQRTAFCDARGLPDFTWKWKQPAKAQDLAIFEG